MISFNILVMFLTSVAASSRFLEQQNLQDALKKILLGSHFHHDHGRYDEHSHSHEAHHADHENTNIGSLNFVIKHNNILPRNSRVKSSGQSQSESDFENGVLGKLANRCGKHQDATRCGCSGKHDMRCGCGRSGEPCNKDHDHSNDANNRADPTVIALLDDLEKTLLSDVRTVNYKGLLNTDDNHNDHHHTNNDNKIGPKNSLIAAKNHLDNTEFLRCCRNCATRSYYRSDSNDDDDNYLRCCRKCSRTRSTQRIFLDGDNNQNDDRDNDEDNEPNGTFLRCCKRCGGLRAFQDDDKAYLRCCRSCGKNSYRTSTKNRKKDINDIISSAKVFQLNDDFDAIVLDVSDLNNVLKVLNNGNNLDSSNSIKDYVRSSMESLPTSSGKLNLFSKLLGNNKTGNNLSRRSPSPDTEKYGLPFELDVQGLGQVNP